MAPRQQWRGLIETRRPRGRDDPVQVAPRQQWRGLIETASSFRTHFRNDMAPRQQWRGLIETDPCGTVLRRSCRLHVSNGVASLKPIFWRIDRPSLRIGSTSAMAWPH